MVSQPEGQVATPGDPPGSASPRPGRFRIVAVGVGRGVVAVLVYAQVSDGSQDATPPLASSAPPSATVPPAPEASEVYRAVLPSLVFVRTDESEVLAGGIGSGVVINDRGYVMTAHHVVDSGASITVTFADGTESPATIVEADPATDIAVLAPAQLPESVVPAVLGGEVEVGDDVYPLGSPLGFRGSITAGVVSGLDRTILREDGAGSLEGLIQFDAAVNPGSSGGPLVDAGARVVGIVTALANPTDQRTFIGLGFAVPISTAGGVAGEIER